MIHFIEDKNNGYSHRTYENARLADATIAFAADFTTSGEKMTKNAAEKYQKVYCQIPLNCKTIGEFQEYVKNAAKILKENNCHTLNIAGNGMSRLVNHGITQKHCDCLIYAAISIFVKNEGIEIKTIRSGGQTGADESGLKAAKDLNIEAFCLCPRGWRFRTETTDISDEVQFKKRFEK